MTEVMQHINLDNMLSSVVPQLLSVSGRLRRYMSPSGLLTPSTCRVPVPARPRIRLCKLFRSHPVRKGY